MFIPPFLFPGGTPCVFPGVGPSISVTPPDIIIITTVVTSIRLIPRRVVSLQIFVRYHYPHADGDEKESDVREHEVGYLFNLSHLYDFSL